VIEEISHYKILKKIGAGGMGEVYLAEDQKLNRKVALKILPAALSGDRKSLNRFLQEARLAANLNHPHICTIYEINESAETPFLAMELVDGETLADKLKTSPFDLSEVLNIASQIADALDEAHRSSIIHRDIKSLNVIINRRGQVKILDFGLAKFISEEVSEQEITRAKTEAGMLVGTVQYMSPEQALGKKLDGRTDLWSLGILLYEMACGQMPFSAVTQAGVFDEILHKQPVAPTELNAQISPELENVILKLLEKDRDFRYQTASDLNADLKRLRRTSGESFESSEAVRFNSMETSRSAVVPAKNKISRMILPGLVGVMALVGLAFAVYYFVPRKTSAFSLAETKSSRLTNLGKVSDANVSDDGKYVAYVVDEGARQSLWLKQIENGGNVQIIPTSDVVYQGVKISPDGNWIYYNVWDKKSVGEIFRVPVLGGIPQKIVRDCMPSLTISPDGKRLVFIRSNDQTRTMQLVSAAIGNTDEKIVYETNPSLGGIYAAAFAPDGKTLALVGYFPDGSGEYKTQIVEMPVEGGDLKTIWIAGKETFGFASTPQWLPDKSGLLVSLSSGEIYNQLWLINYTDGTQTALNNDFNSYDSVSITADGKSFVGVQREFFLSIWTLPSNNSSQAKRLSEGKIEGIGIDWTPDGKIIYSSSVSGKFNLWMINPADGEKRQLTDDNFTNIFPCVSFDGKTVLFQTSRRGYRRLALDEKEPKDVELNNFNSISGCQRSENSFLYTSFEESSLGLTKIDFNKNQKTSVLPVRAQQAEISSDGKQIAYTFWDENEKRVRNELMNFETKQIKPLVIPQTAIRDTNQSRYIFHWTPDGKNLAYVDHQNGVSNIWFYPVDGGKAKQITDFKDYLIQDFSFSRDGKQIAVSRGMFLSDVVLFKSLN
jgi:eukaryotic-like serine/threonine-protein kinase